MPVITSFTNGLVTENKAQQVDFFDSGLNQQAKKDFCYLVQKGGLAYSVNLKHLVLSGSTNSNICDCAVIGADISKTKMLTFPTDVIRREDNAYIAIVLYDKSNVIGVYLHDVVDVKKKRGLLSIYKDLKKTNEYGIKLGGYKKWEEKKFGYVLRDYLRQ